MLAGIKVHRWDGNREKTIYRKRQRKRAINIRTAKCVGEKKTRRSTKFNYTCRENKVPPLMESAQICGAIFASERRVKLGESKCSGSSLYLCTVPHVPREGPLTFSFNRPRSSLSLFVSKNTEDSCIEIIDAVQRGFFFFIHVRYTFFINTA